MRRCNGSQVSAATALLVSRTSARLRICSSARSSIGNCSSVRQPAEGAAKQPPPGAPGCRLRRLSVPLFFSTEDGKAGGGGNGTVGRWRWLTTGPCTVVHRIEACCTNAGLDEESAIDERFGGVATQSLTAPTQTEAS